MPHFSSQQRIQGWTILCAKYEKNVVVLIRKTNEENVDISFIKSL